MSLLPKRSLRLTGQTTEYYQRFTGSSGEIYYDKTLQTLRIFPGNAAVGKVIAAFDLGGRLPLGSDLGAIYANQTTGMITIGDAIGTTGAPAAPSTVVQIGGAANAFAISAYGPPSVGWQFGRDGALILPGDIKSNGNINIEINLADSTKRIWQFGEDGSLTFPGTPRIDTSTNNFEVQAAEAINFEANTVVNIYTDISGTTKQWQFGDSGDLSVPGDVQFADGSIITDNLEATGDFGISTAANIGFMIDTNESAHTWLFGTDGSLTFPDATVQSTAWAGIPGPYADDAAAAAAGVAVDYPYHKTGTSGQVFVRLT